MLPYTGTFSSSGFGGFAQKVKYKPKPRKIGIAAQRNPASITGCSKNQLANQIAASACPYSAKDAPNPNIQAGLNPLCMAVCATDKLINPGGREPIKLSKRPARNNTGK